MGLSLLLASGVVVALVIGWGQLSIWQSRPAVEELNSPAELERYVRSWGQWLEERGRIAVEHIESGAQVEFRKQRRRTHADSLIFRFRNADSGRAHFASVRAAFDAAGAPYDLELTPRRRQPRALAVVLDPADVLAPLIAVQLVSLVFGATTASEDPRLLVWAEGRMRDIGDAPDVEIIPWTESGRAGFRLGGALGRLFRPSRARHRH